jgi:hypothetical protein
MTGSGPMYARLLRLRHLRLGQLTAFILCEGSVLIAVMLALADIIRWSGVFVIPVAVAVMVKLNDVVAGVLARPVAIAQLNTGRMLAGPAVGLSPMPRPARMTTAIDWDDALSDRRARPGRPAPRSRSNRVVRGIASVPYPEGLPRPGVDPPHPGGADGRGRGNKGRFSA